MYCYQSALLQYTIIMVTEADVIHNARGASPSTAVFCVLVRKLFDRFCWPAGSMAGKRRRRGSFVRG